MAPRLSLPLFGSLAVSASMPHVPLPQPGFILIRSPRLTGQPGRHRKHLCSDTAQACFFLFARLYFLIHPFLYVDLLMSSGMFWSPCRSSPIFISKHPNIFLVPPPTPPHAACREGSASGAQGGGGGQEAAGGWAAGSWLLTWTPEQSLRQEGVSVSPQLLACPGLLPPEVQELFWKWEKITQVEAADFPTST